MVSILQLLQNSLPNSCHCGTSPYSYISMDLYSSIPLQTPFSINYMDLSKDFSLTSEFPEIAFFDRLSTATLYLRET